MTAHQIRAGPDRGECKAKEMTSRAAPRLQETIHHRRSFGRRGREGGGQHGGAELGRATVIVPCYPSALPPPPVRAAARDR